MPASIYGAAKGSLNEFTKEKDIQKLDISHDSIIEIKRKTLRSAITPHFKLRGRKLLGWCFYILTPTERQSLLTSSSPYLNWVRTGDTTSEPNHKACLIYIPDVHSGRPLPDSILAPSPGDLQKMKTFLPVFISETEELGQLPLNVGDMVQVIIPESSKSGGGIYTKKININSSINLIKKKGGKDASSAFKCEFRKSAKVVSKNKNQVTAGTTVGGETSGTTIDAATREQQYIKYLYEKERLYIKTLKADWSKGSFMQALATELTDNQGTEPELNISLIKGIMYQICGFVVSGLSVGGSITASAQAIKDYYGIFRISKKQFDATIAKFPDKFATTYEKDHSNLLDPKFAMKYFAIDFQDYLKQKSIPTDVDIAAVLANDSYKQTITKYFTDSSTKKDFLFFDKFTEIADLGAFTESPPNIKVDGVEPFEDWLIAKAQGIPVELTAKDKIEPAATNNEQGPTKNKQKTTPETCSSTPAHSNYPSGIPYLLHIDSQKKMVRNFLESPISGLDLEFISAEHVGVKDIKFADLKIPTEFKVLRFDSESPIYSDNKRWINRQNNNFYLSFNERLLNNYYRSKNQISHFTVGTLSNTGLNFKNFYREYFHTMLSLGKPFPHFVVCPNGQIIQLVDAAGIMDYNMPVSKFTIFAAFAEGMTDSSPVLLDNAQLTKNNCVLVKQNNESQYYRYHKLGTKAALQSMQKLIQFFLFNTNLKYDLAAQDRKFLPIDINKSSIQAHGQYKGIGGMNFIYYAWTLGLAYYNNGKNILSYKKEI